MRAWQEKTRKIDFTVRVYHNILAGISSRSIDEVVKSNVKPRYSDKNLPRVVPIVETAHKHCVKQGDIKSFWLKFLCAGL